jgi:hypothetical protein
MSKYATDYGAAGALTGAEIFQIVQSGTDKQLSMSNLLAWLVAQQNDFSKSQRVIPVVNSSATGTVTPDASASNNFDYTLTGNLTIANPTNLEAGVVLNFRLRQDATGGRTITLGSKFKWPSGTSPTWVTTANGINFFSAYYDSASDALLCGGGAGYA